MFNQMPKATKGTGGNRYTTAEAREIPPAGKFSNDESEEEEPPAKPKLEVAADMGFNKNQGDAKDNIAAQTVSIKTFQRGQGRLKKFFSFKVGDRAPMFSRRNAKNL